jgi:peptidyl-prolyl cis-trans isomerase A (cyclophilin A)
VRLTLGLALCCALAAPARAQQGRVTVEIVTTLGVITAQLDSNRAPITVTNFMRYVNTQRYDGGRFHRTVKPDNQPDKTIKIEVIQGGLRPDSARKEATPITLERTNRTGYKHLDGTLSMARNGPDTATSDFFICIGAQPELDFGGMRNPDGQGFAAFGRVTSGMEIVRKIQQSPADGQRLTPPVQILRITRLK